MNGLVTNTNTNTKGYVIAEQICCRTDYLLNGIVTLRNQNKLINEYKDMYANICAK